MLVILYFNHECKWTTKIPIIYIYEENQHYKKERLFSPQKKQKQKWKITIKIPW